MFIVSTEKRNNGDLILIFRLNDVKLIGKNANIKVFLDSESWHYLGSKSVRNSSLLFEVNIPVTDLVLRVCVPKENVEGFVYNGKFLKTWYRSVLKIKDTHEYVLDGIYFKNINHNNERVKVKVKEEQAYSKRRFLFPMQKLPGGERKGMFDLRKSFSIMPLGAKIQIVLYGLIFIFSLLFFLVFKFKISDADIFYSGDIVGVLGMFFGGFMFLYISSYAYKYLKVTLIKDCPFVKYDAQLKVKDFVNAISTIDLKNVTVAVIARNYEMGKYNVKMKGMDYSTPFREMVKEIVLYEKKVDIIPKHVQAESYFVEPIDFGKMYDELIPVMNITPDFGMDFDVKIHFKTPDFPDISVTLPTDRFEKIGF